MAARETLLLVDGHALVYRAFYAMPALTNSRGELTNAAFGFTSMLLKALGEHRPTHAIAAFDPPGPTFRHDELEEYKAQRAPTPDELRPQIPWCREVVGRLCIPMLEVARYEADDVIGTLSHKAEQAGLDVLILTGDLDALQLVTDHVRVYASRRGISETIVYDRERVLERYGFSPSLVADYKALHGDVSDNIPGVPGIGEKTAGELIRTYGPLEQILAALPAMKPGKVKRVLEEHREQALHSKRMATIVTDLDVDLDLDGSRLGDYDPGPIRELFERLEFRSLIPRLPPSSRARTRLESGVGNGANPARARDADVEAEEVRPGDGQGSLDLRPAPLAPVSVETVVIREVEQARAAVEAVRRRGSFALRTVAIGPPWRGLVRGVAFLPESDPAKAYYLPVDHGGALAEPREPSLAVDGDGNDAEPEAIALVEQLLADESVEKVGYDLKQDVLAWAGRGVAVRGLRFDCMLAAYLCLSTRTRVPSIAGLGRDLVQLDLPHEEELYGSGRQRLAPEAVSVDALAAHLGRLISALPAIRAALDRQLDEEGFRHLHDHLELPLVPILAAMETVGIRIDCDQLAALSAELHERIGAIEAEVQEIAGYSFNLGSTQQLARFLYDDLGLASGRRTKTGRSTAAEALEALRDEHPAVGLVLEWRQLAKLKGTYVDALPLLVDRSGRLHTSFNQAVATTGRLSSADPNLQNVPIRTTWGQRIRRAFVADPGYRLVSADYSQIELRLLAHESREPALIESFRRGEDIHRRTAAQVCSVDPAAVTPDMRRNAKVVNFGVVYGLSDFGLARGTGMSKEDARAFIDAYFDNFPAITAYLEQVRQHARQWGWVQTFTGRRRHIPDIRAANRQIRQAAERMAVNMPIQGGAADIMKRAMILVDAALRGRGLRSRLLLQVHDELVLEAPDDEVDALVPLLCREMGGAAELIVPLEVDVKVGDNWQDMTPASV
ncbi:MAG TPA: DNA polymerase I [Candidatus Sulfotelmatobacter sp.]|nr:DNA polymerase I [Candidatus Sulfotelmatobacter sp.]